jgi:hypothetical protein
MSGQETAASNAAKYRRLAEDVRHDARLAHDVLVRAQLLAIAESYERLATTVQLIARRQSVRRDADPEALLNPLQPVRVIIDGNAEGGDGALQAADISLYPDKGSCNSA